MRITHPQGMSKLRRGDCEGKKGVDRNEISTIGSTRVLNLDNIIAGLYSFLAMI
jgi:hypothetical protein